MRRIRALRVLRFRLSVQPVELRYLLHKIKISFFFLSVFLFSFRILRTQNSFAFLWAVAKDGILVLSASVFALFVPTFVTELKKSKKQKICEEKEDCYTLGTLCPPVIIEKRGSETKELLLTTSRVPTHQKTQIT